MKNSKSKKNKHSGKKFENIHRPYTVHVSPIFDEQQFPTHTHGLTDLGMPEFIGDIFSFGSCGMSSRLHAAYEYFSRPENTKKLGTILTGKKIILTGKELQPDLDYDYEIVYGFEEIPVESEAVKQAYLSKALQLESEMRFIKISVVSALP